MTARSLWARSLEAVLDVSVVGSFGAPGFALRKRSFADPELAVDLAGRVVVVTGASAGLGEEVARLLVARGATVIGVSRDGARAEAAARRILDGARDSAGHQGKGTFSVELCDLSLMREVRALAARLAARPALHVLINNAGVLPLTRTLTAEGHELAFATNVLAPHLLIRELAPHLAASAPARIVNVTSGGMYLARLDLTALQGKTGTYDGVGAYAQTKRAEVILTELWSAKLAGRGVTVNSVHPGWAETPGVERSLPVFNALMRPVLRSAAQGADGIAFLAASPEVERVSGELFFDRCPRTTDLTRFTRASPELRAALFALVERATS